MTRRKGEVTARMNERECPHLVELAQPEGGCGNTLEAIDPFHREAGIALRRGRRQRRHDQEFSRWCFITPELAGAFHAQFGGGASTCRRGSGDDTGLLRFDANTGTPQSSVVIATAAGR